MKRKADEEAAAARREQGGAQGLPSGEEAQNFELPDEFKKFMG